MAPDSLLVSWIRIMQGLGKSVCFTKLIEDSDGQPGLARQTSRIKFKFFHIPCKAQHNLVLAHLISFNPPLLSPLWEWSWSNFISVSLTRSFSLCSYSRLHPSHTALSSGKVLKVFQIMPLIDTTAWHPQKTFHLVLF